MKTGRRHRREFNAVKRRIAMWLTLLTALLTLLLLAYILIISDTVANETARNELIRILRENAPLVSLVEGRLTVGNGFRYASGGITTLIYSQNETLLAGQIPVEYGEVLPFENGVIRVVGEEGQYLVLDLWVPSGWEAGVWLRGITEAPDHRAMTYNMILWTLLTLPLFLLLAAWGAYAICRRAFRPLDRIHATASAIHEAKDLKGRIGLPAGEDEFSRLAATFDGMFERLERSFESEKRFAADASHELRTPISIIKSACDYAERYGEDDSPAERRENIGIIHRQADRMAKMITQLLHMTRMEQGTEQVDLVHMDLAAETLALSRMLYPDDPRVCVSAEGKVWVKADRDLLSRLLQNLVDNAIKYSDPPERAEVTVSVRAEESEAILSVSDLGIGIPETEREKIFARFYRVDPARADGDSTGLGLSLVQYIAQCLGGSVTLQSEVGWGSTFAVHLPIAASEQKNQK